MHGGGEGAGWYDSHGTTRSVDAGKCFTHQTDHDQDNIDHVDHPDNIDNIDHTDHLDHPDHLDHMYA